MWTCKLVDNPLPAHNCNIVVASNCMSTVDILLGDKWVGPSCVPVVDKNPGHTSIHSYNTPLPCTQKYTNVRASMRKENDKNDMMEALDYFRGRQPVDLRLY